MDGVTVTQTERERLHEDIKRIHMTLMSEEEESDESDEEGEQKFAIDGDGRIGQTVEYSRTDEHVEPMPGTSGLHAVEREIVNQEEAHSIIGDGSLPQTPKVCLALNHTYQEVIRENLECIQMMLTLNQEKQSLVKAEMEAAGVKKQLPQNPQKSRHNFSVPYITSSNNLIPVPNPDTLAKKANREINVYTQREEATWTPELLEKLVKAVKADRIMQLTRPFMNKKNLLYEKLKEGEIKEEEMDEQIGLLDQQIIAAKYATSEDEMYGDPDDSDAIDWLKISNVDMDGAHSAINCQRMWQNAVHPKINKDKWTREEDEALLVLAAEHGECDWQSIANELGTGRKAFQCLQRYQSKVNPCLHTGRWLPAEDKILVECIEHCSVDETVNWNQVANAMEGRSVEQCTKRWEELQKTYRRGRWVEEEDVRLMAAVEMFGTGDWNTVAEFVPGRSGTQCRERWLNVLDSNLKHGSWNYLEDRIIIMRAPEFNFGWKAIAELLPGRTDAMVSSRYKVMMKWKEQREYLKTLPGYSDDLLNMAASGRVTTEQRVQQVMASLKKVKKGKRVSLSRECMGKVTRSDDKLELEKFLSESYSRQDLEKLNKMQGMKDISECDLQIAAIRLHDQEVGIDVPQPPLTLNLTRNLVKKMESRNRVHDLIQHRIKTALKTKQQPSSIKTDALAASVKRIFFNQDPTPREKKLIGKVNKLKDATNVAKMVEIINEVKGLMRKRARGKMTNKRRDIQNEILSILSNRCSKGKKGRPRKFVDDTITLEEKADPERAKELDNKVLQLMFKALNVDLKTAIQNGLENMDVAADNEEQRRRKKRNTPSLQAIQTDLAPLLQIGKASGAVSEEEEVAVKVALPENRAARFGQEAVIYNTPLLPPSHGTLYAFKQLLLQRNTLKEQMNVKATKAPSPESAPTEEEVITSTDMTPGVCRKMPGFTVRDLLAAKRRLLHKEQHDTAESEGTGDDTHKDSDSASTQSKRSSLSAATVLRSNLFTVQRTHDYQMLQARMRSMFLWPALLSTIKPPEEPTPVPSQNQNACNESAIPKKPEPKRKPSKKPAMLNSKRWRKLRLKGAEAKAELGKRIQMGLEQSRMKKEMEKDQSCLEDGQLPVEADDPGNSTQGKIGERRKKREMPEQLRRGSRAIKPPDFLELEGKKGPKPKMVRVMKRKQEVVEEDGLPLAIFPKKQRRKARVDAALKNNSDSLHMPGNIAGDISTPLSSAQVLSPQPGPFPVLVNSDRPSPSLGLASSVSALSASGPLASLGLIPVTTPSTNSASVLPMIVMLPNMTTMNCIAPLNNALSAIPITTSLQGVTKGDVEASVGTVTIPLATGQDGSEVTLQLSTNNSVESDGNIDMNDTSQSLTAAAPECAENLDVGEIKEEG